MDFGNAFNVIDHDLPLRNLALYGVPNDTLHIMFSFLCKLRKACLYEHN